MKIKLLSLGIIVASTSVLSGCGQKVGSKDLLGHYYIEDKKISREKEVIREDSPNDKILKIAWWGTPYRTEQTQQIIRIFEQQNSGVKVEMQFSTWEEYWHELATQAASNSLPDIIQQDYKYITQYVEKGLLEPLDEYIQNGKIDLSQVSDSIKNLGKINEKIYGVCLGINTQAMLYNKEIIEELGIELDKPMTWSEYEKLCYKIYKEVNIKSSLIYKEDVLKGLELNIRNEGKSFYTEDGEHLGFEQVHLIEEYFETVERLMKKKIISTPDMYTGIKTIEESLILKTRVWNEWMWSNEAIAFINASPNNIGVTFMPQAEVKKQYNQYFKPSMFFSISDRAEDKELAAKFINFYTNSVEVQEIVGGDRGVPISDEVRQKLLPKIDETNQMIYKYMEEVKKYSSPIGPPESAKTGKITELAYILLEEVMYNLIQPSQAAEKFMKEANRILGED